MRKPFLLVAAAAAILVPVAAQASGFAMHPALTAKLTGGVEVPKGSPTAHGTANVTLKAASGQVCWRFNISGVSKPSAAHIHKGGPGVAGPVVVPFGTAYKATGCTKASKTLIQAIETTPSAYYVNVHNAKYKAGAIRGQLKF